MHIQLESCVSAPTPPEQAFQAWAALALASIPDASLALRIVTKQEMAALNEQYRGKNTPTNVLSFPADIPKDVVTQLDFSPLGDIAICADVVESEAQEQNKPPLAHWAHMVIHGCLHLIGYDHIEDQDAERMEQLETRLLNQLGFADPYEGTPAADQPISLGSSLSLIHI